MRIVICGGGVIGACLARYLACRGAEVTVVERTAVAAAASGKAGGFLALDWCDGSPLGPLARRSFALHETLARETSEEWGYRRLDTFSGVERGGNVGRPLPWLSANIHLAGQLGTTRTTAQVDPARFTRAMMREAESHGARLRIGTVEGLAQTDSRIRGVVVDGRAVEADAVVLAMGPWSLLACEWLPLPAIYGLKGHSIVFETGTLPPAALFLEAGGDTPEVFPRPDGTAYVCGLSSETPLPLDPANVAPDPGAIERLQALCGRIAPTFDAAPIRAAQACYRPITVDGLPLIGPVPGHDGVWLATGHNCWGILNAPATGEALANLILDGASPHLDLAPFDPARLPAMKAGSVRTARAVG